MKGGAIRPIPLSGARAQNFYKNLLTKENFYVIIFLEKEKKGDL